MLTLEKLYPLYFSINHRCHTCQRITVASAMQIVAKRQRYFCPACATAKGYLPAQELLSRLPEALEAQAKAKPSPGQKLSQCGATDWLICYKIHYNSI